MYILLFAKNISFEFRMCPNLRHTTLQLVIIVQFMPAGLVAVLSILMAARYCYRAITTTKGVKENQ